MGDLELAVLIDFGSTFTKVAAVDLHRGAVVATSMRPTTVAAGVTLGLSRALAALSAQLPPRARIVRRLASSSAAGGLRMVTIGLAPTLTAEAARRAALGAGARVVGVYSYRLGPSQVAEIAALEPDIILLAGGTDGGNRTVLEHNAAALARGGLQIPVVVAGNPDAAPAAARLLTAAGCPVYASANVLPDLRTLQVDEARATIGQVFLERITAAKGIKQAEEMIDGVLMPTPVAVQAAGRLLAEGAGREPGMGELMVVDVGGATTDVHSVADGRPRLPGVVTKGVPEPRIKRTVEGDLGVRINAGTILDMYLAAGGRDDGSLAAGAHRRVAEPDYLPQSPDDLDVDARLAAFAVEVAVGRHAGRLLAAYTAAGAAYTQVGKDLTAVRHVIGTGGPLVHSPAPERILQAAAAPAAERDVLKPRQPQLWVDSAYVLYAVGLVSTWDPELAVRVGRGALRPLPCGEPTLVQGRQP